MQDLPKFDQLLTIDDFAPLVGRIFEVETVPKPIEMRLEKLTRRPMNPLSAREPFVLTFSTPLDTLLVQATYRMHCGRDGSFEIFLTPTQAPWERTRRLYHAVFA